MHIQQSIVKTPRGFTRNVVFDSETTGFEARNGDRMVELGAIEMKGDKGGEYFHSYFNPEREVPEDAVKIHGLTTERLAEEPLFYHKIEEFLDFVKGSNLIAHNASFDVNFINAEMERASRRLGQDLGKLEDYCDIIDTLEMAKKLFPGKRVSLDALCKRLDVENGHRELHGALLDSEILLDVFVKMSTMEVNQAFSEELKPYTDEIEVKPLNLNRRPRVVRSNDMEM